LFCLVDDVQNIDLKDQRYGCLKNLSGSEM
jgi:hypothetical protein